MEFTTKNNEVLCPVCGFEYNHFLSVKVIAPHHNTINIVGSNEVKLTKYEPTGTFTSNVRGTEIQIEYSCENGHHWIFAQFFYKGTIETKIIQLPELEEEYDSLWRD